MPHAVVQSFFRGDSHIIEMIERDSLGRSVGEIVTVTLPSSSTLRAALAADYAAATGAQEAVIEAAKVDVAEGRQPEKLVATSEDVRPTK